MHFLLTVICTVANGGILFREYHHQVFNDRCSPLRTRVIFPVDIQTIPLPHGFSFIITHVQIILLMNSRNLLRQ